MNPDYIECRRFSCKKDAKVCMTLDRYRVCRRVCKALESHITSNPALVDNVLQHTIHTHDTTRVCKDLPNAELRCPRCDFIAKSTRGLKTHLSRSHRRDYALKRA